MTALAELHRRWPWIIQGKITNSMPGLWLWDSPLLGMMHLLKCQIGTVFTTLSLRNTVFKPYVANFKLCKCIISWDSQLPWVFSREGGWNIVPHGHPRIWHIRPDGGRSVSSAQESSRLGGLARSVGLARWSRFWGCVVMEISQFFAGSSCCLLIDSEVWLRK